MPQKDVQARREYQARWRNQHREQRALAGAKYYRTHREQILRTNKEKLQSDPVWAEARRAQGREWHRKNFRKYRYGLSEEQIRELWIGQDQACALCRRPIPFELVQVDHDHTTEKVRGLLCRNCNTGLGCLGDSLEGLERARNYLKGQSHG